MKKMFTTKNPETMAALHQFLLAQHIPITVNERGESLELWVTQTSYYAIAKQCIDDFKADPEAATQAVKNSVKAAQSATEQTGTPRASSGGLRGLLPAALFAHAGIVTMSLAVIVIAVYLLLLTPAAEALFEVLRVSPYFDTLAPTEIWRFITPAVLHFSAMHFFFNLFWWWYLGGRIEHQLGSLTLVLLFVGSAVIANLAQFYSSGPYFGGLSGVVYGLLGFCAVLSYRQPRHPLYLPPGLLVFMIGWLLLGYTDLLWVKVANEAHLAGLVSGLAGAVIYRQIAQLRRPR